jgi:hypothetical protein
MDKKSTHIICKSIFKSGEGKPTVPQFNQMWIELINQSEKNKSISSAKN